MDGADSVDGARRALVSAEVVAIIPTLGDSSRLARCVASLGEASGGHDLRILVVVNGGDGGVPPRQEGRATVVETGVNLGWAGGLEFARARVDGTYLWTVQDDMLLLPGCLDALIAALQSDAGLGAARPLIVDERGRVRRRSAGGYLAADGTIARGWPMLPRDPRRGTIPTDLDFVAGSGMLVRAQAWDEAGGWDWRYYPVQYADVDFGRRLAAAGWRQALVREARARHEGSASTPSHLRFLLAFHNRRRFEAVWGSGGEGAVDSPRIEAPRVHEDISTERLADLLALSNGALFDLDNWLATQRIRRPVSQRVRGAYWTMRAALDPRL